ncbi:MAG: aminotransferase class V-fold PLP-dependent enzyme [Vicinamibacteria bacterium]|nr:aminotransferase class V-fold PLP-dependent enzyme [Vicinamibacteria bacterium]
MATIWNELRADFPALGNFVYLNAAAASPTPKPVSEAVTRFYREMEEGGDAFWSEWLARLEEARIKLARFIHAETDEIAFVPNASTGMNLIVDLLGGDGPVLANEMEFPNVTLPWIHRGVPVHFTPTVEGVVRLESYEQTNSPRAATIAVSHVQYSNGCRQDLKDFGSIKAARNLVVAGSQGVGAFPVDVREARIDALTASGHQWLCAGYGAGFMYVNRKIIAERPPLAIGWKSVRRPYEFDNRRYEIVQAARRVEMGCPALGPVFALGAAVHYLMGIGIDLIAERILALNMYLTLQLEREGFEVLSPGGEHRSGQTLCVVENPPATVEFLRENGILVTTKPQGVRISTHYYNNEEDIEACVRGLKAFRQTCSD